MSISIPAIFLSTHYVSGIMPFFTFIVLFESHNNPIKEIMIFTFSGKKCHETTKWANQQLKQSIVLYVHLLICFIMAQTISPDSRLLNRPPPWKPAHILASHSLYMKSLPLLPPPSPLVSSHLKNCLLFLLHPH